MPPTNSSQTLPDPPRGIRAILWRLPIWFYRLKLGWMFGHRALLLTHIGRVSGMPRQAMLEVVQYDEDTNTHYVASGFGEQADWYRNIINNPEVTIQVAGKEISVIAKRLSTQEAAEIFSEYHRRHPKALHGLGKLIGYAIPENEADMLAFFRDNVPLIAFQPRGKMQQLD
ncbi:MAG: nitroreductase family deazaflavin-dependent oxidoreductase [Anaerolineales bacterium]|nr:nitroreductase family deazaflavin-dependent oxidoreductase [Chloroflexota bacterium]MBL6980955.1 nitroreductase family deazaflavin-dependent oxidoreductase [Anaerolineales bacterium]